MVPIPSDRSDAFVLTFAFVDDRGQRFRVEPGSQDPRAEWTYVEEIKIKGGWKVLGSEAVREVAIENAHALQPDSATDALREHLEAAFETATADPAETRRHLREALQLLDALEAGV